MYFIECTRNHLLSSSAVAYEDFIPVDLNLMFNEETPNKQTVSVPILNDICLEEDGEHFFIVVTSDMDCVDIDNGEVTIMIDDDDGEDFRIFQEVIVKILLPSGQNNCG